METAMSEPDVHVWNLDDALTIIRKIRPTLQAVGWELALGGGVLNRGWSDKDLDLVAFPTTSEEYARSYLHEALVAAGWKRTHTVKQMHAFWEKTGVGDRKWVEVYRLPDGRRVDVISLGGRT